MTAIHGYRIRDLGGLLFASGWIAALLAFFEQCLDNGFPVWSTVFGFPFPHHGYLGFAACLIGYLLSRVDDNS